MHNFQNLSIWKEAVDVAQNIYAITKKFPKEEVYALSSQMQRAAVSIPSNIAEGAGRSTNKDFANFLGIAIGSCFELHTQILLSERLHYITAEQRESLVSQLNQLQPQIVNFKKKLESNNEVVQHPTTKCSNIN